MYETFLKLAKKAIVIWSYRCCFAQQIKLYSTVVHTYIWFSFEIKRKSNASWKGGCINKSIMISAWMDELSRSRASCIGSKYRNIELSKYRNIEISKYRNIEQSKYGNVEARACAGEPRGRTRKSTTKIERWTMRRNWEGCRDKMAAVRIPILTLVLFSCLLIIVEHVVARYLATAKGTIADGTLGYDMAGGRANQPKR